MSLNDTTPITRLQASGNVDEGFEFITSTVDVSGFRGVRIIVEMGEIPEGVAVYLSLYGSQDQFIYDQERATDLNKGFALNHDFSNRIFLMDLPNPSCRYIACYVGVEGEGSAPSQPPRTVFIDSILAELYEPGMTPVALDNTVGGAT